MLRSRQPAAGIAHPAEPPDRQPPLSRLTCLTPAPTCRLLQSNTLERRLFYIPSFKIYGSVAGFYDYGPPGCAMKQNVTQEWRNHFVLEENMLEVHAGGSLCLGCCVVVVQVVAVWHGTTAAVRQQGCMRAPA